MDLILSVLADPKGANMLKHTKLFTPAGGSLGRADDNSWVLPDPERVVSSKHVAITFSDNQYYLVDNSTNGTYLNQGTEPIGKGNRVPLNEGDIIGLGDYQLKVTIRQSQTGSELPKGLGGTDFLDGADRTTFSAAAAAKMQSQVEAQQLDSWLEPGAGHEASRSAGWGYFEAGAASASAGSLIAPDPEPVDPLAMIGTRKNSDLNAGWDPLGEFAEASSPVAGSQWQDDDWWKDGSGQDHAPAHQHAMSLNVQQPRARAPASPQAAQPKLQPQPPSPQAKADNPFAASFAVMQGQQVEGAPGFNSGGQPDEGTSLASPQPQGRSAGLQPAAPGVSPVLAPQPPCPPLPQAPCADAPALMTALGLNLTAEQGLQLDQQVSGIVLETVTRLIDLLRARSSIKNELRVQRTMIQMEANNPLKFSATAADALGVMFSGNGAFMPPQQSIRDGFDDLSDHQIAVLEGMRAGYEAMLKFFSPDNIERRVNNRGGVFGSKSAKSWEGFKEMYIELQSDPEACYRRLFGDEFATTYEYRLSELKNKR